MSAREERCDVAIIGAGPVGLFLGALLAQQGIDVRVFERRSERALLSRAVGVHPPGLLALAKVGVADALVQRGLRVRAGIAHAGQRALGSIGFDQLPGPYRFVLCVPQWQTEALLEARLQALAPAAHRAGRELVALEQADGDVELALRSAAGRERVRAKLVVGCDGKQSRVRESLAIPFRGSSYARWFLMGDAPDLTAFGAQAAVFMTEHGLVESFPLPGGQRRWVVSTGARQAASDARLLCEMVRVRTGQRVEPSAASCVSTFQAEHYLADRFAAGRVLLAGDAAHVVSPIGGQGMNLGLLDALSALPWIDAALASSSASAAMAADYDRTRRRAAQLARRRSELFMSLARAPRFALLRDLLVQALLSRPISASSARLFTMHDASAALALGGTPPSSASAAP